MRTQMWNPRRPTTRPAATRRATTRLAIAITIAAATILTVTAATPTPAAAQPVTNRGFGQAFIGFQDVNGNGALDCNEPVTLAAFYIDQAPDPARGSITGRLVAPFAGAAGLAFVPGSVAIDYVHTAGACVPTITTGNAPTDVEATVDFACAAPPPGGPPPPGQRANVVAILYQARFTGTQPSFTAVLHGTTSDGLDQAPQLVHTDGIGAACQPGGGNGSVTVTKTVAGTGVPGSTLLYTLAVADQSGLGLGGLELTDQVPAYTVFNAAASSPGWSCPGAAPAATAAPAGSLCRLQAGNLDRNATVTRYFAVDLLPALPAGVSAVTNTACARSGPSLVVGCGTVTTPTAGRPVLALAKTLASGTGAPGGTVVYDLSVLNSGTQDSGPVTLAETVPAHAAWTGGGGWTCASSTPGASCTLPLSNLAAAGGTAAAQFPVILDNPLPAGVASIDNTACARAAAAAETCSTLTLPTTGRPVLALAKTVTGTAAPGSRLNYLITVQNTGNQDAANVTLTDVVPQLTRYVATGSSPAWTCPATAAGTSCKATIPTLPAGASAPLVFVVEIASPLPANVDTVLNVACAAAPAVPPACAQINVPTTGQPILRLAKTYAGGPVLPAALLLFDLAIANTGNQDVGSAVVADTVPPLSTFDATASDPRWSCAATVPGAVCTLGLPAVPAGSSQTLAFAVRAAPTLPQAAVIANAACVTALPPPAHEAAATALRRALARGERPTQIQTPQACGSVSTPPALAVQTTLAATVVGHPAPAAPGDRIRYTLTIPNPAAATLAALVATAALDLNTTLAPGSVTTSQGTVATGNGPTDRTVEVALGDLAPAATATIEWEVTVNTPLPPAITQVAAQVETRGANIPPDESGPPPPPSIPGSTATPVTAASGPPPAPPIPTLGELGLATMALLLAAAAALALRRRRSAGAGPAAPAGTPGAAG
jgi:uncharacterized repeat protein (TIGR01451 family)